MISSSHPMSGRIKIKGFTFIETMVAIFVFLLTLGAIAGLMVMVYRTYGFSWQQSLAINEARRGIEIMVKEIREARSGDDGSYPISKAQDKEFVFYSDIDQDGDTERVRYFLGTVGGGSQTQECVTFNHGGNCQVTFSNFLSGALESAQVKISLEGDFGWSQEYAEVFADGIKLGDLCRSGCSDCAGAWQGTTLFDVTSQAQDNHLELLADATSQVNAFCDWQENNHAMKARFELTWSENLAGTENELKKGVTKPTGSPIGYPPSQEKISVISSYVRNAPPIFRYFDGEGNEIIDLPARLADTKLMKVYLVIDVNPEREPEDFTLESAVQLRNLKSGSGSPTPL